MGIWLCGLAALLVSVEVAQAGRQRSRCRAVSSYCSAPAPTPVDCECSSMSGGEWGESRSRTVTEASSVDCAGGVCRSRTVSTSRGSTAQAKADQLAARGQLLHLGGSFGGGTHEGIGVGSTPDQATQSCCFWGQRTPIEIGTAQGRDGRWYAVVLYR